MSCTEELKEHNIDSEIASLQSSQNWEEAARLLQEGDNMSLTAYKSTLAILSGTLGIQLPLAITSSVSTEESFPVEALPPVLYDFVCTQAKEKQISPSMLAPPCLAAISLGAMKKFCVHVSKNYFEPVNLWTLIVARPSERKSAAFETVFAPVFAWQNSENQRLEPYIAKSEAHLKALEHKRSQIERQMELDGKAPNLELELADVEMELKTAEKDAVHPVKLWLTNVNSQSFEKALSENKEKIAILDSEATIFDMLTNMCSSKAGSAASDLSTFLHTYSGEGMRTERITRRNIVLQNPYSVFCVFIQNTVLDKLLENSNFTERGFTARFLINRPKSMIGTRLAPSDVPAAPQEVTEAWNALVKSILDIPLGETPNALELSAAAQTAAREYYYQIEQILNNVVGSKEYVLGKLYGTTMRIAGVLHIARLGSMAGAECISLHTMESAIAIAKYYKIQADTLYGESEDNQVAKNAQYILSMLKNHSLAGTIMTQNEIRHSCAKLKDRACKKDFETAIQLLEKHNFLFAYNEINDYRCGRKPKMWRISPFAAIKDEKFFLEE